MKGLLLIFCMLFLVSAGDCRGAESLQQTDFPYCADLKGSVQGKGLYRIRLRSDILEKCTAECSDLRLFDTGSREIPYVILSNEYPEEVSEAYPLEIVGYDEGPNSAAVIMKLPEKYSPIRLIDLDIADRDFRREFQLRGSRDGDAWENVAQGALYDFSSQVALRKTEIGFDKAGYRYYRLEIKQPHAGQKSGKSISLSYDGLNFSVNGHEGKTLQIRKITGKTGIRSERVRIYDEKDLRVISSETDKGGDTVMTVPVDVPVERLFFDVSNPYYYREVEVYFSTDGKKDSYASIGRAPIFSFPMSGAEETRNYLGISSNRPGFFRLIVKNRNNPPLEIKRITASWTQKYLYFIPYRDAGEYSLCFGNAGLNKPDYELTNFISQYNWFKQQYEDRETGSVRTNTEYKEKMPEARKKKIEKLLLTSIVVLLVVGIGFWLFGLMKKTTGNKQ